MLDEPLPVTVLSICPQCIWDLSILRHYRSQLAFLMGPVLLGRTAAWPPNTLLPPPTSRCM